VTERVYFTFATNLAADAGHGEAAVDEHAVIVTSVVVLPGSLQSARNERPFTVAAAQFELFDEAGVDRTLLIAISTTASAAYSRDRMSRTEMVLPMLDVA
jgi:hypothetical protein